MSNEPLICVLDDDESVRESLPRLLEELGFRTRTFSSASEFLESGIEVDAQCLVLDIAMPGMTGPELQTELLEGHCALPLIFITGTAEECERKRVVERGAVDCLVKPFSEQQLLSAIERALSFRERDG